MVPLVAIMLLALPEELMVKIAEHSEGEAVVKIEQLCRSLRNIVAESTRLQYLKECFLVGKVPLASQRAPSSTLLESVRSENHAWSTLSFNLLGSEFLDATEHSVVLEGDHLYTAHVERPNPQASDASTLRITIQNLLSGRTQKRAVLIPSSVHAHGPPECIWKLVPRDNLLLLMRYVSVRRNGPSNGMIDDFIHTAELKFLTLNGEDHRAARAAQLTFEYESDDNQDWNLAAEFLPEIAICGDTIALGYHNREKIEVKLYQWTTGVMSSMPLFLPIGMFDPTGDYLHFLTRDVLLQIRPDHIDVVVGARNQGPDSYRHVVSLALPAFIASFALGAVKVRAASSASDLEHQELEGSSYHHAHSDPGVFTLTFSLRQVQSEGPGPSHPRAVRFLALTIQSSAILAYKDADYLASVVLRVTGSASADGEVPVVPWLQWSHGAVHIIDAPHHNLTHTGLGVFGSRVLYATRSSTTKRTTEARQFVLHAFNKGRRPFPSESTPEAPSEGDEPDDSAGSDSAARRQEWTRHENENAPLPENCPNLLTAPPTLMPFTRVARPFPPDSAATTPELEAARYVRLAVDDVVFNDKYVVLVETLSEMEGPGRRARALSSRHRLTVFRV